MDIDRYNRLCSSFNEEYLSNYDASSQPLIWYDVNSQPLIWFRHWYVRRLYWI